MARHLTGYVAQDEWACVQRHHLDGILVLLVALLSPQLDCSPLFSGRAAAVLVEPPPHSENIQGLRRRQNRGSPTAGNARGLRSGRKGRPYLPAT